MANVYNGFALSEEDVVSLNAFLQHYIFYYYYHTHASDDDYYNEGGDDKDLQFYYC